MEKAKKILKSVKRIELNTKNLVDGLLQGSYHSVFKGRGIEFSEVREYVPGDDIRTIDWNVTARMNSPYIKEFIEERDLTLYVLFDISASSDFGSAKEKKELAAEISASLFFSAMRNNDKCGVILFSDEVEKFIPAKKGKEHMMRLIREMIYYKPKKKGTDINKALSFASKIIKKRSIIFIVSDFIAPINPKLLRYIKRNNDVIALHLYDNREIEFPDIGFIELEDSETGETIIVNTSDKEFRKNYLTLSKKKKKEIESFFRLNLIDYVPINTDDSFENPLRKFFFNRMRRVIS
jgi:uncharacterized protein (DUF58 family)